MSNLGKILEAASSTVPGVERILEANIKSSLKLRGTPDCIKKALADIGKNLYPNRILDYNYDEKTSTLTFTPAVAASSAEQDVIQYCVVNNVQTSYTLDNTKISSDTTKSLLDKLSKDTLAQDIIKRNQVSNPVAGAKVIAK